MDGNADTLCACNEQINFKFLHNFNLSSESALNNQMKGAETIRNFNMR